MALITMPTTPKPAAVRWKLTQPSQVNISGWTGARQAMSSGWGWWECDITLPPIVGESNAGAWKAFAAAAKGPVNTFNVTAAINQQSSLSNTVTVNGAAQVGRSISTKGWPNSQTVMTAGQFITIGGQLFQVTANAVSNGSGIAVISVAPNIRVSPADNAAVEYKNPYAVMYCAEDPDFTIEVGPIFSFRFNLREAF